MQDLYSKALLQNSGRSSDSLRSTCKYTLYNADSAQNFARYNNVGTTVDVYACPMLS